MQLFQCSSKTILLSHEGTIQGDPSAIAVYWTGLTPLLKQLVTCYPEKDYKMVALAGDLIKPGRLLKLCSWWNELLDVCPNYGYFRKQNKIILIVKPKYMLKAVEIFNNTNIKTSSAQRHLVAVIESRLYWKEYSEEIVSKWRDELCYQRSLKYKPRQLVLQLYMALKVNTISSSALFQLGKIISRVLKMFLEIILFFPSLVNDQFLYIYGNHSSTYTT